MSLSGKKERLKVPLENDVIMKCKCGMCPVQVISVCSTPQIRKMIDTRAAAYCSVGLADCKDLDNSKACICRQCQVYEDFTLATGRPVEYFCFNGKAI